MILPAFLAAAIASAPAAPVPPPLPAHPEIWRGARAGMTQAEVQELFPKGHGPAGDAPTLKDAAAGWAMDEEVYGREGVATFYFQRGRLSSALVALKAVPAHSTGTNMAAARELATQLSGYYGKPKDCVDVSRRSLDRMDCRWTPTGLQVGLSYLDYGGVSAELDLSVQVPPPKPPLTGAVFKAKGHKM